MGTDRPGEKKQTTLLEEELHLFDLAPQCLYSLCATVGLFGAFN